WCRSSTRTAVPAHSKPRTRRSSGSSSRCIQAGASRRSMRTRSLPAAAACTASRSSNRADPTAPFLSPEHIALKMKVASRALCAAIACALGIESTAAFADDASSAPSTDADLQLETITVTAEKREQSVNDIGVAVTAFSARDVEQLGFSSYKDIADQT